MARKRKTRKPQEEVLKDGGDVTSVENADLPRNLEQK